jgi:hypothetical protein
MSAHSVPLDRRRAELLRRSAELRAELDVIAEDLRERLQPVDKGTKFVRRNAGKLLIGGTAALLLMKAPRRLLKLAGPLAVAWPILRPWVPKLASLVASRRAGSSD